MTETKVTADQIRAELSLLVNPQKAKVYKRFFKTGKGEYGEGDRFLGLTVPQQRAVAKKYQQIDLPQLEILLKSPLHEHRLTALLILTYKYPKADEEEKERIYHFYLNNKEQINNWDLVDLSVYKIVGDYLLSHPNKQAILEKLATSSSVWDRRIAIIATFAFIKKGKLNKTLEIAELLVRDSHDLIHKAVGWMLRELGKVNQAKEEAFLQKHYQTMSRTMLRYSIEKFNESKRRFYLGK